MLFKNADMEYCWNNTVLHSLSSLGHCLMQFLELGEIHILDKILAKNGIKKKFGKCNFWPIYFISAICPIWLFYFKIWKVLKDSTNEIRIRWGSPVLKNSKVAKSHINGDRIGGSLRKFGIPSTFCWQCKTVLGFAPQLWSC